MSIVCSRLRTVRLGRGRNRSEAVDDVGHRSLIDVARDAGVTRFVYTSALGAAPNQPIDFFRTKWAIEQHLASSGLRICRTPPRGAHGMACACVQRERHSRQRAHRDPRHGNEATELRRGARRSRDRGGGIDRRAAARALDRRSAVLATSPMTKWHGYMRRSRACPHASSTFRGRRSPQSARSRARSIPASRASCACRV